MVKQRQVTIRMSNGGINLGVRRDVVYLKDDSLLRPLVNMQVGKKYVILKLDADFLEDGRSYTWICFDMSDVEDRLSVLAYRKYWWHNVTVDYSFLRLYFLWFHRGARKTC